MTASKQKKVERGTLYFGGEKCKEVLVVPANGKKFTYEELSLAVGGFIETMVPANPRTRVYVNEEGALKQLPPNQHTWSFADRDTYVVFNGYAPNFRVAGDALVVFKQDVVDASTGFTIAQAVRS
jgi:hypothetical protein